MKAPVPKILCACIVLAILVFGMAPRTEADTTQDMLKEMQLQLKALQNRVAELEKQNHALEQKLQTPSLPVSSTGSDAADKPAIRSNLAADVYGYIKLDAAYDSHRTDNGNFTTHVLPEDLSNNDGTFNLTARQSRLGLNIYGPEFGSATSSGKFEVDFYGAGGAENKSLLRMRKAYLKLDWLDSDFSILAGQEEDVVSPLYPKTANFLVQGGAGNLGYRHPQLRFTKGFAVTEDSRFEVATALSRTIGDQIANSPGDTGEDAGFPTVQGRIGYSFPFLADKNSAIGLSAHYGQEEYDLDKANTNINYDSWSVNLDLSIPLTKQLILQGEVYTGENLDDYYAGIFQGVDPILMTEIGSTGGWGALSYTPNTKWNFNAGYSIEDLDGDDLTIGKREKNQSVFGNVFYAINKATVVGFETSYWDTEYLGIADGDSLRFQGTLLYKF
jgi:hypothetical protein